MLNLTITTYTYVEYLLHHNKNIDLPLLWPKLSFFSFKMSKICLKYVFILSYARNTLVCNTYSYDTGILSQVL